MGCNFSAQQAFKDDNVGKYHFVIARGPNANSRYFSAFAFLRQKVQTGGDALNGNVPSQWYVFGGQVVYPRCDIKKKDFVVMASDLLYMCRSWVKEFEKVTKAMSMFALEAEQRMDVEPEEPVVIPETSSEDGQDEEGANREGELGVIYMAD